MRNHYGKIFLLCSLLLLIFPIHAMADSEIGFLIEAVGVTYVFSFLPVFILEGIIIKYVLNISFPKALINSFFMNLLSTNCGSCVC